MLLVFLRRRNHPASSPGILPTTTYAFLLTNADETALLISAFNQWNLLD
jgi:hypothetical protein